MKEPTQFREVPTGLAAPRRRRSRCSARNAVLLVILLLLSLRPIVDLIKLHPPEGSLFG